MSQVMSSDTMTISKIEEESWVDVTHITQNQGLILTGFKLQIIRLRLQLRLLWTILKTYPSPLDWMGAFRYMMKLRKEILGGKKIKKAAMINGLIRMGIYTPPWFSSGFNQFIQAQLYDYKQSSHSVNRFTMIFMAITNKCAMKCDHCYHWDELNNPNELSNRELVAMIKTIQKQGVGHIQLSGGEPLMRMDAIEEILQQCGKESEFWLATSGVGLTIDKANHLKSLGLVGVIISLDHFEEAEHNQFRHHPKAFQWVKRAILNADKAGLIVAISSCLTEAMTKDDSISGLMDLVRSWGVNYVQWLEPMDAGHYKGQEVILPPTKIKKIEEWYLRYNFHPEYKEYPIVMYPGYHQRRMGCMFSGKKSVYITANGHVQACPFCQDDFGKFDVEAPENLWNRMKAKGCVRFINGQDSSTFRLV